MLVMRETLEVPAPILLNTWKHHAGAIREHTAVTISGGAEALERLPAQLRVIGTDLMDLYLGRLSASRIAAEVLRQVQGQTPLERTAYRSWLEKSGGFRLLAIAEDQSQWVLRLGEDEERFIHIHPGRGSPETRRVRANVLKTAILVLAHAGVHGGDPLDLKLIDSIRPRLELPPVGKLAADGGLAEVIQLLRVS
jgi:hypothetical protein